MSTSERTSVRPWRLGTSTVIALTLWALLRSAGAPQELAISAFVGWLVGGGLCFALYDRIREESARPGRTSPATAGSGWWRFLKLAVRGYVRSA